MNIDEFYQKYPEFNEIGSPTSIMEKLVIDDFNSRTCDTCKFGVNDCDDGYLYCDILGTDFPKTFGCNRWEAK